MQRLENETKLFFYEIRWFLAYFTSSSLASGMSCLISDKQSFILRRLFRSISGFRGDLVKNEMKMQVAKRQTCQGGIVIQK